MEQVNNQAGKRRRKALWAAVAVVTIAAAGVVGAKTIYESKVSEFVALNGGRADSVEVDFLGRVHLRNLKFSLPDHTVIRIAAVDGQHKIPFLKSELELKGVEILKPFISVSMPQVRVEEASFDHARLTDSNVPISKRMESFEAKSISAPEMIIAGFNNPPIENALYKNVVLSDIANGKIAQYSADSVSFDTSTNIPTDNDAAKTKRLSVSTGTILGNDFDFAYIARIRTEKAGTDDVAKRVWGALSVKKIEVSDGENQISYDEIRSNGLTMRMPSEPLEDMLKSLPETTSLKELPPRERQAIFAKGQSVIDMFVKNDIELVGFKVDGPDKQEAGKRAQYSIARTVLQTDGRKLNIVSNGMSLGTGEDKLEIAEASLSGFDWSSTVEGLYKLVGLNEQEIENFPYNELMPELGTIRVAGIDADFTTPKTEGDEATVAVPERVKFTLKNYEMALTKPHNGIPSDILIKQEDLTLPIPEDTTDEAFVQLRKLGLETLTLSYALSAGWDEANKNLVIREISLDGKDIGSVNFSGLVSGFTEEFFTLDTNRIQAALFGLAGREAKLTVKDEGLIAKGIKLFAAENGMTEEQARGALTMVATIGLQQAASERPNLQGVTEAVLRFVGTPGTLNMTARAKGPNGLGVFDLVAASQNPMLLLDKVEIEATAN